MAMVMVSCSKEAREPIDLDYYEPVYELQTESCLDCAMHFGRWTHSYSEDNGLLHHSTFYFDHNANVDSDDPRAVLCAFIESIPNHPIQVYHVWNNSRLLTSSNNHFVIRWGYTDAEISGAVLIEKESGRMHTLIVNER